MAPIHLRMSGYVVSIVTHVTNVLYMLSCFHGDVMKNDYVRHYNNMQYFFFTCWTFTFQTVYATIALYSDILVLKNSKAGDYELPKSLVQIRELYFSVFVWPSTMFTSTVFWAMFLYDRDLLYREDIDLAIPSLCNHVMHTSIAVFTLWEALFRPRTAPKEHGWRFQSVLAVELIYILVLVGVYVTKGVWVYPIFGLLIGSVFFYLFFVFIAAYLYVIYHAQWAFNDIVWGANEKAPRVNTLLCYARKTVNRVLWGPRAKKTE